MFSEAATAAKITNLEIYNMDAIFDYLLCAAECVLSIVLAGLVLSLPAVSCLQTIAAGGVMALIASVLLCAVLLAFTLIAYAAVTAVVTRTHYLY